jgi:uncharacterized protein YegL
MSLKDFVSREPRALPVFILADKSGSMEGEKINELNLALREMLTTLKNTTDIRGKFQLAIIGFGEDVEIIQPLADLPEISLRELSAEGQTPMGEAFDVLSAMLEDKDCVSSRAFTPTIVLISDGLPTDSPQEHMSFSELLEWEPLKNLQHGGERSRKCQRLAMGIGQDADIDMLKAFINNPEIPVIKSKDATGISAFFKWLTMSTINRMNSVNPNILGLPPPVFDVDSLDIII